MRYERWIVSAVVACFVMMAFIFNLNSPLLEAPNEVEHYRFMRLIAENGELPDRAGYPYGQLHQAPLYYIVGSPILRIFDDPAWDDISQRFNPYHAHEFNMPSNDNKNVHLHLEADKDTNVPTIVFWMRVYSTILGTLTLITGYFILRLVFPERPALRLFGLGIIAFTPQFVYMSAAINNDNFLFLGVALSFYLVLHQSIHKPTYLKSVLLGASLGIALLSKSSAGMLVFPMAIATLIDRRTWFKYAPITLAVTVLVAGWWYLENYAMYGDFTGVQTMFITWPSEIMGEGGTPLWDVGIQRAWYGYESFWGRFGHGAVALGEEVYLFFDAVVIISLIGLAIWVFKQLRGERKFTQQQIHTTAIVVSFTLVWIAALIYSSSTVLSGNQGRYLLPGFAGWGIFIAIGLHQLLPQRVRLYGAIAFLVLMGSMLFYAQARYFIPAYQIQPAQGDGETIFQYEGIVELIGIEPTRFEAEPNELIELTLSWRVLEETDRDLLAFVHSVDSDIVRRDSYPATGLLLAQDWKIGDTWSETYLIRIPEDIERQRIYRLIAGYYDLATDTTLTATDTNGNDFTPFVGEIIVHGEPNSIDAAYQLGDLYTMTEPQISQSDDSLDICFDWNVEQETSATYQVFVHLLDDENTIVEQADFQPTNGAYPTTFWQSGEVVNHCQTITPETFDGITGIAIGMYDLATVTRLPLSTTDGQPLPDNILRLAFPSE